MASPRAPPGTRSHGPSQLSTLPAAPCSSHHGARSHHAALLSRDPAQDSSRRTNETENSLSNINKLKGSYCLKVDSFAVKSRSHL